MMKPREESMPKRLGGQIRQVGTSAVMGPLGFLLFGLPFVGIGTFMALIGFEMLDLRGGLRGDEGALMGCFGLLFVLAGFWVWGMAAQAWFARRDRKRRAALYPFSPARQDHAWDPSGQTFSHWRSAAKGAAVLSLATAMLIPFNLLAVSDGSFGLPWVFLGLFDFAILCGWGGAAYLALRALKFPPGHLSYGTFPLPVEGAFELVWTPGRPLENVKKAETVLRCVKEFWEVTQNGSKKSRRLVHMHLFGIQVEWDPAYWNRARSITLPWNLPPGLRPSSISGEEAIFWRLEVRAELPGVDLYEEFLVPVYAGG